MAGDWIKVEKCTPRKPEIREIARRCKCSVGDAFLAWFQLWSAFDDQTSDGFIRFYTPEDADCDASLPGIADALEQCGWLVFSPSGCQIMNYERHNGASAKQRSLTARRVAKHRYKCNATSVTNVTHAPLQM